MRITSYTEQPLMMFDGDTAEGREGLKEAKGEFELDARVWLPFAAKTYHISPNIEDYVFVTTPLCPSDIPNRNGIGFPLAELTKFQPPPVSRMVYKSWAGVPMHLEHDNKDCTKALGAVLDTSLHKINGFGNGKLWKVMALVALDKTKYTDVVQDVIDKRINTYSMGADAGSFTCSYCGCPFTERQCCQHLDPLAQIQWNVVRDYEGNQHLAFLNAHDIVGCEFSVVAEPAWPVALSDTIHTGIDKYSSPY